MATLKKIEIAGYKSIEHAEIELRGLNVLIGANGAGKSNLLSFFRLAREMQYGRLQNLVGKEGGANTLLSYGAKTTRQIEAKLSFVNGTENILHGFRLGFTVTDSLQVEHEDILFPNANGQSSFGPAFVQESGLARSIDVLRFSDQESAARAGEMVVQNVRNWGVFQFSDTTPTAGIRRRCYVGDNQALHSDASNLAAFLCKLQLSRSAAYHRIIQTVQQIVPWFGDFVLESIKPNETDVLLNWRDRYSENVFGPHQLPDGALRAMALITLLLQPTEDLPSLIVIDEPELGLHPAAIVVVAGLMKAASLHSQVIIATQSVTLLEEFDAADVIVVDREDGHSTFTRQDPERLKDWLEEYSLGELWQKNVMGGGPF